MSKKAVMPHRRGGFLFYRFVGSVAEGVFCVAASKGFWVALFSDDQCQRARFKIQRVSDQLELSKSAPQMVSNDQR
jgi:hypothetical protein